MNTFLFTENNNSVLSMERAVMFIYFDRLVQRLTVRLIFGLSPCASLYIVSETPLVEALLSISEGNNNPLEKA